MGPWDALKPWHLCRLTPDEGYERSAQRAADKVEAEGKTTYNKIMGFFGGAKEQAKETGYSSNTMLEQGPITLQSMHLVERIPGFSHSI